MLSSVLDCPEFIIPLFHYIIKIHILTSVCEHLFFCHTHYPQVHQPCYHNLKHLTYPYNSLCNFFFCLHTLFFSDRVKLKVIKHVIPIVCTIRIISTIIECDCFLFGFCFNGYVSITSSFNSMINVFITNAPCRVQCFLSIHYHIISMRVQSWIRRNLLCSLQFR